MTTQKRLKELFHYDPVTGIWTRLIAIAASSKVGEQAGYISGNKYRYLTIEGEVYQSSRLAFLYMTGKWPDKQVDHIDRNRSNDAWSNLREATQEQNNHNQKMRKDNTSGYRGVCWVNDRNKWKAQVFLNKKHNHLGYFTDKEDAINAYKKFVSEHHKDFASCLSK